MILENNGLLPKHESSCSTRMMGSGVRGCPVKPQQTPIGLGLDPIADECLPQHGLLLDPSAHLTLHTSTIFILHLSKLGIQIPLLVFRWSSDSRRHASSRWPLKRCRRLRFLQSSIGHL